MQHRCCNFYIPEGRDTQKQCLAAVLSASGAVEPAGCYEVLVWLQELGVQGVNTELDCNVVVGSMEIKQM